MVARRDNRVESARKPETTRRGFLQTAGVAAAASVSPLILRATDKAGSKNAVLGEGAHQYEVVTQSFGEIPASIPWGETHGVTVDSAGLIYVTHRSSVPDPVDAVVVFDP